MTFFALGIGIGTKNKKNEWLDTYFPYPIFNPSKDLVEQISSLVKFSGGNETIEIDSPTCHALETLFIQEDASEMLSVVTAMERSKQPRVIVILERDEEAQSIPEIYLKLHLLSHRFVKPNQINLTNIFEMLPNVVWTSDGALDIDELAEHKVANRVNGSVLQVYSVDKFPQMTNYVMPKGVRIADTSRVRLGAHIGEGTTVMHEGFVNFNAGTVGKGMIEGRISSGVIIGDGSDLGGGCSTMGTLSGGNQTIISVGDKCLIGANAGIGISLGDCCTVEAGLYVTAGSKVTFIGEGKKRQIVKASELSGKSNLLFRRNSMNGAIECLRNDSEIELNDSLHNHN